MKYNHQNWNTWYFKVRFFFHLCKKSTLRNLLSSFFFLRWQFCSNWYCSHWWKISDVASQHNLIRFQNDSNDCHIKTQVVFALCLNKTQIVLLDATIASHLSALMSIPWNFRHSKDKWNISIENDFGEMQTEWKLNYIWNTSTQ